MRQSYTRRLAIEGKCLLIVGVGRGLIFRFRTCLSWFREGRACMYTGILTGGHKTEVGFA